MDTSWRTFIFDTLTMGVLSSLVVLLFLTTTSSSTRNVARIAVLLPADDRHMFSIKRVAPALDHARIMVKRRHLLHHTGLTVQYGDSRCSNADGMNEAVTFYAKKEVDVFFGPCCDYAAAPVARQVAYWNIPLVTAGAMAKDFGKKTNKEFSVLTRVGANFNSLGYYMIKVFNYYGWSRIKLLYNPNGQETVMHRFCHIATDGVHYALRTKKHLGNFTQSVHKFHKLSEALDNMPENIGLDFGGK